MFLEKMTTAQAETAFDRDPLVVIPIGSTEQHGPQCALGTDFLVPRYLAEQIADLDRVVVAPTVPFGVCGYHMSFSGTIDLGVDGLYTVISRVTGSLMQHGARRFLVINGHGGNNPAIDRAALDVYHAGGVLASVDWWSVVGQLDGRFAGGGHGDKLETSAMLAIDPECVDLSLAKDMNPQNPTEEIKAQYIQMVNFHGGSVRLPRDTREIAPSGWFGPMDPRQASREYGQAMLAVCVKFLREFIPEYLKMNPSTGGTP